MAMGSKAEIPSKSNLVTTPLPPPPPPPSGCWWVTVAENEEDAEGALALAASIRATSNIKQACIIVPPKSSSSDSSVISERMRGFLGSSFTEVLEYDEKDFDNVDGGVGLPVNIKLVLSAWKICSCVKAIFLHPKSLILANSDELFGAQGKFSMVSLLELSEAEIFREFSPMANTMTIRPNWIFVFEPNLRNFEGLKRELSESRGTVSLDRVLNWWSATGSKETVFALGHEKIINTSIRDLGSGVGPPTLTCARTRPQPSEPIAIVGLACRFPDANNEAEFWELLAEGRDATRALPARRHYMRMRAQGEGGPGDSPVEIEERPAGFLKCAVDEFDAKFFHISRREAEYMDPQQRLLLEVAWEALENAAVNPQSLSGSNTSVHMGIWAQEYAQVAQFDRSVQSRSSNDFHFQYLGNALCAATARVSHFLGLRGPSITMESGCASALEAIHYGCEALRHGDTDLVISGGVNVALNSGRTLTGFDSFILSKDGKCKTFDASANGFARGEACVVLILKRLSDAQRDGNEILGLLAGSAVNSDGAGSSLGTPNAEAQEQVMRQALAKARVRPHEVSYVEAHGTGTPVGDPLEFHAINQVFGNDPERTQPLFVGSVKTNIGHTEGASGASGLVKVLLAMKHRKIPKHLNLVNLNPNIDLGQIPAIIPQALTEWKASSTKGLIAGLSSFGLSGTNVHMIVQEPPSPSSMKLNTRRKRPDKMERSQHIMVLSAASETALNALVDRYVNLLESEPSINLADLAYSVNTGRAHLPYRLTLMAENTEQALNRLRKGQYSSGKIPPAGKTQRIGFLFTGQGSQYAVMAKELYETHPHFKHCLDHCSQLLRDNYSLDVDLLAIISDGQLLSQHAQPALFCIEICLAQLWQSFGIHPDFVLGHSVGELAAAVVAGFISLEDGLKLVVERSRLVSGLAEGSMLVVKAGREPVQKLMVEFERKDRKELGNTWIDIAAVNSVEETVVSGSPESIAAFEQFCGAKSGVHTLRLPATHAFHSRAMDPILEDYERIADSIQTIMWHDASKSEGRRPKFISATLGREIKAAKELNSKYWVANLRQPVNFADAFNELAKLGCNVFVEVGPQPVLLGLGMGVLQQLNSSVWCPSLRGNENNWTTILTSLSRLHLAGISVDWEGFDASFTRSRIRPLPNYPFERERYWATSTGIDAENVAVDSLRVNSGLLHPLLGRRIPCPRSELVTYYNSLRLDSHSHAHALAYLKDHKVADTVIMPAAGYLELVLAAGCDVLGGGFRSAISLSVESFCVQAALPLLEEGSGSVQIQTAVNAIASSETEKGNGGQIKYDVSAYKQMLYDSGSGSDGASWRKLVSATFVPCAPIDATMSGNVDLDSLRSTLTPRSGVDDLYANLDQAGINFGPLFKSIRRVWASDSLVLAETALPEGADKYVHHPIVLDSMIQGFVMSTSLALRSETKAMSGLGLQLQLQLQLPVGIKKFVSVPRPATEKLYMLIKTLKTPEAEGVSLYNENGEFMCMMEGLELMSTSVEAFLRSIRSEGTIYPTFYDQTWIRQLSWTESRVKLLPPSPSSRLIIQIDQDPGHGPQATRAEHAQFVQEVRSLSGLEKENRWMDQLVYWYLVKSVRALGWDSVARARDRACTSTFVSVSEFGSQAAVLPQHFKLLRRWFQILAEEGHVLFVDDDGDRMELRKPLPEDEQVDAGIQSSSSALQAHNAHLECEFIAKFGERLAPLMRGQGSPLALLFPEGVGVGKGKGSIDSEASALYRDTISANIIHKYLGYSLIDMVSHLCSGLNDNNGSVLRILEIGAGTGSATEAVLKQLESAGFAYEYTFTDISPLFLKQGSERFAGNKRIHYQLLDIEQDPKAQGFVPASFDVVIADFVLHATRSLASSVQHVRSLLRPAGLLVILEIVRRIRASDISFGFLDGWWRFAEADQNLRKDHPCIDGETWSRLLTAHGFSRIESNVWNGAFPDFALIVSQADASGGVVTVSLNEAANVSVSVSEAPHDTWLLFGGGEADFLTQSIKNQLEAVGQHVIRVHRAVYEPESSKSNTSSGKVTEIRSGESDSFRSLLQSVQEGAGGGHKLAGVVYLWAASASEKGVGNGEDLDLDSSLTDLCEPLLYLAQAMLKTGVMSNVHVVTAREQGSVPLPSILLGLLASLNNEILGHRFISIDIEAGLNQESAQIELASRDIFDQLWLRDDELQIALRTGAKYVKRLVQCEPYVRSLPFPATDRFKLTNPGRGSFSDFNIIPATRLELAPEQVEVGVKCSSLNFKDVLVALNTHTGGAEAEPLNTGGGATAQLGLGLDFSGLITRVGSGVTRFRVGDKVFGLTNGGALATHVVVSHKNIWHMPLGGSFEEMAAIPAVLFTVYYFLVQEAKIAKGDRILIHCATGGVGLLAVRVAHHFGAEVYATAGSERKRNYLKSFMNVKHIYSSRNTEFEAGIMRDTNGKGVDIVLNCLTGPGFKEASLSVCARGAGARFLEMSRLNTWSVGEVRALRPDVRYVIQDLSCLEKSGRGSGSGASLDSFGDYEQVFQFGDELRKSGTGRQLLPYTRFTLSRAPDAFLFLQNAKHIGKVVVKMPSTQIEGGRVVHKEDLFNEFGSYLITGGMGGIGLEVAKWMASSGAKYLVLVGRSPPSPKTGSLIERLRDVDKVEILVVQADVSDHEACEMVLDKIRSADFPPLRGIMHAAGVLVNNELRKQSIGSFMATFRPKVHGSWNLHSLTLSQHLQLDHFVLFSSVIGTFGGIGQANHASASRFQDAFAAYRHSLGLPCTSIDWGAWSEVGAAANLGISAERLYGLRSFTPAQGIASLERILLEHRPSVGVTDVADWKVFTRTTLQGRLFDLVKKEGIGKSGGSSSSASAWYERMIKEVNEAEPEDRLELVKEFVENATRETLKLPESDVIDRDADLRTLGIDSLMAMELRGKLHGLIKNEGQNQSAFSLQTFIDNRTINKLAERVTEVLNGQQQQGNDSQLSSEQLLQLVQTDCVLPNEIRAPETSEAPLPSPSQYKRVLLTGGTGMLGIFILNELTTRCPNLVVYCLIDAETNEDATDKLESWLNDFELLETTELDNVICLAGSLPSDRLGLSHELYSELALQIDAIIHSTALSNHVLPYGEHGPEDLRSSNVLGLVNVLKFAVAGKLKRVQHQSNVGIVPTELENTDSSFMSRLEEFPADNYWGEPLLEQGYMLSKFVGEKLITEAVLRRQLPITIVRHNFLSADTKNAVMTAQSSHLFMVIGRKRSQKLTPTSRWSRRTSRLGYLWRSFYMKGLSRVFTRSTTRTSSIFRKSLPSLRSVDSKWPGFHSKNGEPPSSKLKLQNSLLWATCMRKTC